MSETLQRILLPDNCALITSKLDDGNFRMAFRQVRGGIPEPLDEAIYEPEAWRKCGRNLDVLVDKLREHDTWKDMGPVWVEWIDANRPMMPRKM